MKLKRLFPIALVALAIVACTKDPEIVNPNKEETNKEENKGGNKESTTENEQKGSYDYFIYGIADITITTDGGVAVDSKDSEDYRACTVEVDGNNIFPDYKGRGRIRGRGNSTWEWYPKKPYRIKLDEKSEFMGMLSNSDWVLLADYRDVTHLMNNVGFSLANYLGIPFTNHSRYANVTLNGEEMGLYMVTEQVEEGNHRVKLDENTGILLALDINDGPADEPNATNNFYSEVFGMAAAVKYPRDAVASDVTRVKDDFADLEDAIEDLDWDEVNSLLDVESMIKYILVQEIIANVEMDNRPSTRSVYINKYADGSKWIMGPVWDCDGGFSYNWGDMYDSWGYGHTYFESYTNLIFGSDPYNHVGWYGSGVSDFFANLWGMPQFVTLFQEIWNNNKDGMLAYVLDNIEKTEAVIKSAADDDMDLWDISNYTHSTEVRNLKSWLNKRFNYLDGIINAYGGSSSTTDLSEVAIKDAFLISASYEQDGHHYGTTVELSDSQISRIEKALGIDFDDAVSYYDAGSLLFVSVEPDGTLNAENTANSPGHWWNSEGYVCAYAEGYVFSEFDFYSNSFTLGKHPTNCTAGTYEVSQAFVYNGAAAEVKFKITIE